MHLLYISMQFYHYINHITCKVRKEGTYTSVLAVKENVAELNDLVNQMSMTTLIVFQQRG